MNCAHANVPIPVNKCDDYPQRPRIKDIEEVLPYNATVIPSFLSTALWVITVTSSTTAALKSVAALALAASAPAADATSTHETSADLQELSVNEDQDEEQHAYGQAQVEPAVQESDLPSCARTREHIFEKDKHGHDDDSCPRGHISEDRS